MWVVDDLREAINTFQPAIATDSLPIADDGHNSNNPNERSMRLFEASKRALNTLTICDALLPMNPVITGAMDELKSAIDDGHNSNSGT